MCGAGSPAPPSSHPYRAARPAERAMPADAEDVVDGAYTRLDRLYDPPGTTGPPPSGRPSQAPAPVDPAP